MNCHPECSNSTEEKIAESKDLFRVSKRFFDPANCRSTPVFSAQDDTELNSLLIV